MSFFHEEAEEVLKTSQKVDALSEVVVTYPQYQGLGMAVHTENVLQDTSTKSYKIHQQDLPRYIDNILQDTPTRFYNIHRQDLTRYTDKILKDTPTRS